MSASVRTARLLLLVTFVAGWTGSVLGVPAVLELGLHGHEVRLTATDGHVDAVLHHDDHGTGTEVVHEEVVPDGVPVHPDHTVHLPELAAVGVVKTVPAPVFVAVLVPAWAVPARSLTVRPVLSVSVPDERRAALRSTVLLV